MSLQTTNSALFTLQTRRRLRTPSLFLLSDTQPVKSPQPSPSSSSDVQFPTYVLTTPDRSPRRFNEQSLPRARPTPDSPSPLLSIDVEAAFDSDEDGMQISCQLPPTPTPTIHSPSQRQSLVQLQELENHLTDQSKMFINAEAGPSSRLPHSLPPTPPVNDGAAYDIVSPTSLVFDEPTITQRPRRGRRPASVYPVPGGEHVFQPHRKYTDPTPHSRELYHSSSESLHHELDVDLDAYSTTDFDVEENREPTLSFVTLSTTDSTTGTPASIGGRFEFKPEHGNAKLDEEPRIRLRSTTGRTNAYSSAESSMASGAYCFNGYADHDGYQPPPLPVLPSSHVNTTDEVGLGITGHDSLQSRQRDSLSGSSPSTNAPLSPANSFAHRPWKRDVMTRLRSDSASSSITTASVDSHPSGTAGSTSSHAYPFAGYAQNLPWERESYQQTTPEAVALVDEGKERIFDRDQLEAIGGLDALTERNIAVLRGVTHLLLPNIGNELLHALPSLLSVLAPTLVVLDLSDNYLSFLPEALRCCTSLEELNITNNPVRALPSWLGEIVALRMLVADGCMLQNLPTDLSALSSLHTLCARRNRLVSLPSWLCLLNHLETLHVDDNPFAAEWAPIVAPILSSLASVQDMSRPQIPSRSSSQRDNVRSQGSIASLVSSRSSRQSRDLSASGSAPQFEGDVWMSPTSSAAQSMHQISGLGPIAEDHPNSAPIEQAQSMMQPLAPPDDDSPLPLPPSRGLRKMRSAGSLLTQSSENNNSIVSPILSVFGNKPRDSPDVGSSVSTVNSASRFGSLGVRDGLRATPADNNNNDQEMSPPAPSRSAGLPPSTSTKTGKWGFLRKMSMNRLKSDKAEKTAIAASASANLHSLPPPLIHTNSDVGPPQPVRPSINVSRSAMTLPTIRTAGAVPANSSFLGEFGETMMPSSASTLPLGGLNSVSSSSSIFAPTSLASKTRGKRRSFLPVDGPPSINIAIPSASPFMPSAMITEDQALSAVSSAPSYTSFNDNGMIVSAPKQVVEPPSGELDAESRYATGLESIKSYLRDLFDLSRQAIEPYGGFEVLASNDSSCVSSAPSEQPASPSSANTRGSISEARRARRPTLEAQMSRNTSTTSVMDSEKGCFASNDCASAETSDGKKFKNDKSKRARVLREIYETERTYVRGLGELVTIYVKPAGAVVSQSKVGETVVPANERKVVFGGIESILSIHRDNLLPALEKAVRPLLEGKDDDDGELSTRSAHAVGEVFRTYIAYMKQYSTYINNFDNALSRMQTWTAPSSAPGTPAFVGKSQLAGNTPNMASAVTSLGASLGGVTLNNNDPVPHSGVMMSTSQRKRVKAFLKRCREHPMHSQINLESYLLLPIQRVPRYKLLLEDLAMCTLPRSDGPRDTLDDALNEIASLASLMNEEKRDADSRLRLYHWQQRISSRGPSPLVQPHRKLIMDGALTLIRLVKKASSYVEVDNTGFTDNEKTITSSKIVVPVEHIAPEPMDRPMMLVLCTDLLILIQQRPGQSNWEGQVDLFNVLRMATLREPASIVYGNVLRVVDNKSIYYFNGNSQAETVKWCRAINTARRR